ncbi:drug resistance transporter, EmrB/QacA family [Chondromyces apiculatus DSM 436]|uniref:Drug resistance transporter, EmrB/QacA family n=2 Tax=Chondromyces apiculatus TaxID=51 RepID=A0A017SU93_9BACT|nr:drug resistance transporter, EmrB/QacA family [Chondromyces apiculatus DSM 436]
MAALEMTVVSTAMPRIVSDLGGIQNYAWVFTAYMLSSTITVPIYGKLSDLHGRKPVLLFGIGLFLVGSMACGVSSSMEMLIAFRALQGLGAGAMQPMAVTVIGDLYTPAERARVQGVFSAVWGIAGLLGPLTGGLLVKYLSWHWVFFINLPVGLGAAAVLFTSFHENVQRKPQRLDIVGALLLSAGVVALLFGVQGTGKGMVWLPVALLLLVAFVFVERRVSDPLLPMSLFKIPSIAISASAGALVSAAMFGATTYVPLYVQGVLGGSPTLAGGIITPMIVGWPLSSLAAGRLLLRVGYRPIIVGGFGLSVVGSVLMALLLRPGTSMLVPQIGMGLFGIGMGFSSTATMVAVQTSVGWELRGVATANTMFFRTIGGALGVGVMGGVLALQLLRDPSIPVSAANELLGPEHGRSLPPEMLRTLSGALETGLTTNFWIISAFAAVAFLASLFFPRTERVLAATTSAPPTTSTTPTPPASEATAPH